MQHLDIILTKGKGVTCLKSETQSPEEVIKQVM